MIDRERSLPPLILSPPASPPPTEDHQPSSASSAGDKPLLSTRGRRTSLRRDFSPTEDHQPSSTTSSAGDKALLSSRRRTSLRRSFSVGHRGTSVDSTRVSTGIRLRPRLPHELALWGDSCVQVEPPNRIILQDPQSKLERVFECDHVFDSSDQSAAHYADQQAVYDALGAPLVEHSLQGHNACLCAYGQTGTGKTHTVMGTWSRAGDRGLLPRVITNLFSELEDLQRAGATTKVQASYIEIYNSRLRDLLAASAPSLGSLPSPCSAREPPRLRTHSDVDERVQRSGRDAGPKSARLRNADSPANVVSPEASIEEQQLKIHTHPTIGVYVENLMEYQVHREEEAARLVACGEKARQTAATSMNKKSSRSHAIFQLKVEIRNPSAGGNRIATLQVVDLAGRENEQTSECSGDRLRELTFINRSLFELANCVNALSKRKPEEEFVPFRNSKLTLLLSESFTGNSKTCLIATLTPSSTAYDDNLLTCRFLESTGKITTYPVANHMCTDELQGQLETELDQMRQALGLWSGAPSPSAPLDTHIENEIKSREALLRQLAEAEASQQNGAEIKQGLLLDAHSSTGKSLAEAEGCLASLDQTNTDIVNSLSRAEACLSAVESRMQQLRSGGPTRHHKVASESVKLPPILPKIGVTCSVELPSFIEICP